jgi:hypothetical protein
MVKEIVVRTAQCIDYCWGHPSAARGFMVTPKKKLNSKKTNIFLTVIASTGEWRKCPFK